MQYRMTKLFSFSINHIHTGETLEVIKLTPRHNILYQLLPGKLYVDGKFASIQIIDTSKSW